MFYALSLYSWSTLDSKIINSALFTFSELSFKHFNIWFFAQVHLTENVDGNEPCLDLGLKMIKFMLNLG